MTQQKTIKSENLKRRDFICKSAVLCSFMPLLSADKIFAKEIKEKKAATDKPPEELITFCGLFCGACDIYQKRIGNAGSELKEVLDVLEFDTFANQIPGLEEYDSFKKTLNNIIQFFGQCPTCKHGGGNPECRIRICAKDKDLDTCADCSQFPCDKFGDLKEGSKMAIENLKTMKKIGMKKWAKQEQKKVDAGFRYSDLKKENK
jgi:hypothetical protein